MDPPKLTDEERKYYREVWGFDPVTDLVDLPKGEKGYQTVFSLDADPPLHAIGMTMIARVEIRAQGDPHNLMVFSVGDAEQAVYCTHTVIYQDSAENLETLADDEILARMGQARRSPVKLPPWEHFASLKSYVAAIAEAGITNILNASYRSQPDRSHNLPIGFNSAMQAQVFDALFELAPGATESLLMNFLLELGETTPPSWFKSHLPLMHVNLQAFRVILEHAPEFRDTKNPVFLELLDATPDLTEDELRFLEDRVGMDMIRGSTPAECKYNRTISFPLKGDQDLQGIEVVVEDVITREGTKPSIYIAKAGKRTKNIVEAFNNLRDDDSPHFWVSDPAFFYDYIPDLKDLDWYLEKSTSLRLEAKVNAFSFAACCLFAKFIAERGLRFILFASQGSKIENYNFFQIALWRVLDGLKDPGTDHLRFEFIEKLMESAPEDWCITNWRDMCWHFALPSTLFSMEDSGWYRNMPSPLRNKLLRVVMKVYPNSFPPKLDRPGVEIVPLLFDDWIYGWAYERSYPLWEGAEICIHLEHCEDAADSIWLYDGRSLPRVNLMEHAVYFPYLLHDAEQHDEGITLAVMFDAMCAYAEILSRLDLEAIRAAATRYRDIVSSPEKKIQVAGDLLFACVKATSPRAAHAFALQIREILPRVVPGGDKEGFLMFAEVYYPLGDLEGPTRDKLQDLSDAVHGAIEAWKSRGGESRFAQKWNALANNLTFKNHMYKDLAAFREICEGLPGEITWEFRVDATYFPWSSPAVITYLLNDPDPFIRARAALWSPQFPGLFVCGGRFREKDECPLDLQILMNHKDWRLNFIGALRAHEDFSPYTAMFTRDEEEGETDDEYVEKRLDEDFADIFKKERVAAALILNALTPPELARNASSFLDEEQYDQGNEFDFPDYVDYVTPKAPISTFGLFSFLVQFPNYTFHCRLVSRGLSNEGMPENSAITFSGEPTFALLFGWREDGGGLLLRDHGDGTATRYDPRMFLLHFLDEQWEVKTRAKKLTVPQEPLRGYLTNANWKGQRKYPYTSQGPFHMFLDEERYILSKPDDD